ncbi:RNA-directed DNA polymerase [bacterium]|nr:RNA-directed DNA polymerase [bacterium]
MNIYELLNTTSKEVSSIILELDQHYLSYPIAKRNRKTMRWIDAPQGKLKELQETFLHRYLYRFSAHPSCVGFVKGKSVRTGAERHIGTEQLLNMDLKNFFSTIKIYKVAKLLTFLTSRHSTITGKQVTFVNTDDKEKLARLLTYKNTLPQGAPSSPAIANLCAYQMDVQLTALAKNNGCIYTRYADDLTFSTKKTKDKFNIIGMIPQIRETIEKNMFSVNYKKTRVQKQNNRMTVTGVVVNKKLSTPKWYWRNFRAKLHNLEKSGVPITEEEYQEIRGTAEWIKSLHPVRGEKFLETLGKLNLTI